jgi:hypothetical protein
MAAAIIPTALFAGLCLWAVFFVGFDYRIGVGVSPKEAPVSHLPSSAGDVNYALPGLFGSNKYYEFTVSEWAFRNWANSQGWSIEPIPGDGIRIMHGQHLWGQESKHGRDYDVHIEKGWHYDEQWEADAAMHVAYNTETGRAYFYSHSR